MCRQNEIINTHVCWVYLTISNKRSKNIKKIFKETCSDQTTQNKTQSNIIPRITRSKNTNNIHEKSISEIHGQNDSHKDQQNELHNYKMSFISHSSTHLTKPAHAVKPHRFCGSHPKSEESLYTSPATLGAPCRHSHQNPQTSP